MSATAAGGRTAVRLKEKEKEKEEKQENESRSAAAAAAAAEEDFRESYSLFRRTKRVIDLQGKVIVGRVIGFQVGSGSTAPLQQQQQQDMRSAEDKEGAMASLPMYSNSSKVLIDAGLGKEIVLRTNDVVRQVAIDAALLKAASPAPPPQSSPLTLATEEEEQNSRGGEQGGDEVVEGRKETQKEDEKEDNAVPVLIGKRLRLFVETESGLDGEILCSTLEQASGSGGNAMKKRYVLMSLLTHTHAHTHTHTQTHSRLHGALCEVLCASVHTLTLSACVRADDMHLRRSRHTVNACTNTQNARCVERNQEEIQRGRERRWPRTQRM